MAASCGVGHRCGSGVDVAVAQSAAAAPIQPLAWELPYVAGVAIKKEKYWIAKTSEYIYIYIYSCEQCFILVAFSNYNILDL